MAASRSSTTATTSTAIVAGQDKSLEWFNRLVFAPFSPQVDINYYDYDDNNDGSHRHQTIWWPAFLFSNHYEFDQEHDEEAAIDPKYRISLGLTVAQKVVEGAAEAEVKVVRFIGRPLHDVKAVAAGEYKEYMSSHLLGTMYKSVIFHPTYFQERVRRTDQAMALYRDFHMAMDETRLMLPRLVADSHMVLAQRAWPEFAEAVAAGLGPSPSFLPLPPRCFHPCYRSGQPGTQPQPQQAPVHGSPSRSVAAVSVAEESQAYHSRAMATPASTCASAVSHQPNQRQQGSVKNPERYPDIGDPLGEIPWQGTRVHLICGGWIRHRCEDTNKYLYQAYGGGPVMSEEEVQRIAQEHYGWVPPDVESTATVPGTATGTAEVAETVEAPKMPEPEQLSEPQSHAKEYSFAFLWKHKCKPDGWRLVDPYYLRPGVTVDNLNSKIKGEDYFDNQLDILNWCHKNYYYPKDGNSCRDESSVCTEDDPSTVLEEFRGTKSQHAVPSGKTKKQQESLKKRGRLNKKKAKNSKTPKNYTFGVLWASHLEPNGWTMPKAKRNPCTDYYYVRPHCSVEKGRIKIDYFASTDDVLNFCKEHNDYPDSSADDATAATAADGSTIATNDDESTKNPPETEDDQTQKDCSTPPTRTRPQDPGKPLLTSSSSKKDAARKLDDEQKYHWKNLWPMLKNLGWEYRKPQPWQDHRYYRPRKPDFDQNQIGEEYFDTQAEVIEYCKDMDRREAAISSQQKSRQDSDSCSQEIETTAMEEESTMEETVPEEEEQVIKRPSKRRNERGPSMNGAKPPSKQPNNKRKTSSETNPMDAASKLNVRVNPNDNKAPWQTNPIPTMDVHRIVVSVGGFRYTGSRYLPHNQSVLNSAKVFNHPDEALQHACCLRKGNYYVNPDASEEQIQLYERMVAYAYVPGSDFERRHIRALNREEVEGCLQHILKFTRSGDQWKPPNFLCTDDENGIVPPRKLKSSYCSLTELARDLRGVENWEGEHLGRRRGKREQLDDVLLALRLSLADEEIVLSYENKSAAVSIPMTKKRRKEDVFDFPSDSNVTTSGRGPKILSSSQGNEASRSKRKIAQSTSSTKKQKAPITDLDVMYVATPSEPENNAPWARKELRHDWWMIVQKVGVTCSNNMYYLPGETPRRSSASFSSVNEIFKHWCKYGGYNLKTLDKEERTAVMSQIRYGNVPETARFWKVYRELKTDEAERILNLFEFKENADGSWSVPNSLLQSRNSCQEGNPLLLKNHYPSLDELRVALRSVEEFESVSGGRRSAKERKLTKDQYKAFRLWLATGPDGPVDTTVDKPVTIENAEESAGTSEPLIPAAEESKLSMEGGANAMVTDPTEDVSHNLANSSFTLDSTNDETTIPPPVDESTQTLKMPSFDSAIVPAAGKSGEMDKGEDTAAGHGTEASIGPSKQTEDSQGNSAASFGQVYFHDVGNCMPGSRNELFSQLDNDENSFNSESDKYEDARMECDDVPQSLEGLLSTQPNQD